MKITVQPSYTVKFTPINNALLLLILPNFPHFKKEFNNFLERKKIRTFPSHMHGNFSDEYV